MRVQLEGEEIVELGTTETAPTIGIIDYSRRVTDDFGTTTVVERGFARRLSVRLSVPFDGVDALQRRLASLRATSALWVADERYASLAVQGFYKDFSLDLNVPPVSFCTLTVEGLVETALPADPGGDPAPVGQTSTLRLLQPVIIDPVMLTATNVPETDYPEWGADTTYALGARVMRAVAHKVYESVVAGNVGHDPSAGATQWIEVGPTNRWAMFDGALGTSTVKASSIIVTIAPGTVNALALLDVSATSVRVQATGYDRTLAVGAGPVLFLDLPATGVAFTVTITGTEVSVGTLLIGKLVGLGVTEASPTAGITDFSRKEVDDFGEATIVERAWAKRMTARALIRSDATDAVVNRVATVRARPSLWIGQDQLDSLTLYGFFKDFSVEVGESVSMLSLSVEGLSKAAPIVDTTIGWNDIIDDDPAHPKPEDGATVGAPAGTEVAGRPAETVVSMQNAAAAAISAAEGMISAAMAQIATANAALATAQAEIDQAQTDIIAAGGQIGAVVTRLGNAETAITTNATAISNQAGTLASLNTTVGTLGSTVSTQSTAISTLNSNYSTLSSTVSTQGASITSNTSAISNLTGNFASLTTTVGASTEARNRNPNFTDWPAGSWPALWTAWNDIPTKVPGVVGTYSAQFNVALNTDSGMVANWTTDAALDNVPAGGWWVVEADVTLVAGALPGAGVYCVIYNASTVATSLLQLDFSADRDSTGAAQGNGTAGKRYSFAKLFQDGAAGTKIQMYAMANWTGFNGARAAKTIKFNRVVVRPARQDEIELNKPTTGVKALVTTNASAISTLNGQFSSLSSTVSTQGTSISTNASAISTLNSNVASLSSTVSAQGSSISTQATAIGGLQAITTIQDTRSTNQPPSWYWANYPQKAVREFKTSTALGIGALAGGTYGNLTTTTPWQDSSGGPVQQVFVAYDESVAFSRYSTGSSTWSAWTNYVGTLNSNVGTLQGQYASLSSTVSTQGSTVSSNSTAISTLNSNYASLSSTVSTQGSSISSQASSISTLNSNYSSLSSTVSAQGASISSQSTAISTLNGNVSTLFARVSLRLDVNGYVTGYEINNSGSVGNFVINADTFAIVKPGGGQRLEWSNGSLKAYYSNGVVAAEMGVWS
jgi:peptidoglycan hydrolase CwlO-like protein